MRVKRKYLNDLLVYFQKVYQLYHVEFGESMIGNLCITLSNPNNTDWWICLFIDLFSIGIIVVQSGKYDKYRNEIKRSISQKEYKGYGKHVRGDWIKNMIGDVDDSKPMYIY